MDSNDNLDELLVRLAQGEQAAFWTIWQRLRPPLKRLCRRYMQHAISDADDALSTAMLRAFHQLPRHAAQVSDPRAWLTVLTRNVCVDLLRQDKASRGRLDPTQQMTLDDEPVARSNTPPAAEELRQRLSWMSPKLREVVVLRSRGWNCSEIASQLAISEQTTRKRLQRARTLLMDRAQDPARREPARR